MFAVVETFDRNSFKWSHYTRFENALLLNLRDFKSQFISAFVKVFDAEDCK